MNAPLILMLLLPVVLAASPDKKIVGGANVNIANYPWQACLVQFPGTFTFAISFCVDPTFSGNILMKLRYYSNIAIEKEVCTVRSSTRLPLSPTHMAL